MSGRNEHKPHGAWQWNPPARQETADESFHSRKEITSFTECTGLMQHVPEDEGEAHALSSLYGIHTVKPQGNPGKCNPRNNPEEIAFHRQP
ncbi:MAG: hypothetical protein J6K32_00590 [Clostridia bacterium]|nr:hypothetical protein [Clostridia bacterium]